MKPPEGLALDRVDGNGLNDRRCNRRICTQFQHSSPNFPQAAQR